jgi:site-specific DNA-methyltransferase (adenine-specific)
MSETFLNGRVTMHAGDSRDVLKTLADNSIDSIVTDPPYALVSIVKRFGASNAAECIVPEGGSGAYKRASAGFMGKTWDTGETAFDPTFWAECLRVLKPGGHVVAFSGTRTYHRMTCAIEDAGFEVRDMLSWLYGSGFPKSHNAGGGWGTALKPACEPICFGRKSLIGTVAQNVLEHGTGAINIDGCRVDGRERTEYGLATASRTQGVVYGAPTTSADFDATKGRWPANIIHDGSDEVVAVFPDVHGAGSARSGKFGGEYAATSYDMSGAREMGRFGDEGSAARFFYTSKADSDDRLGSKHPTVKPVDLMQYLCRLVTRRLRNEANPQSLAGRDVAEHRSRLRRGAGGADHRVPLVRDQRSTLEQHRHRDHFHHRLNRARLRAAPGI